MKEQTSTWMEELEASVDQARSELDAAQRGYCGDGCVNCFNNVLFAVVKVQDVQAEQKRVRLLLN